MHLGAGMTPVGRWWGHKCFLTALGFIMRGGGEVKAEIKAERNKGLEGSPLTVFPGEPSPPATRTIAAYPVLI